MHPSHDQETPSKVFAKLPVKPTKQACVKEMWALEKALYTYAHLVRDLQNFRFLTRQEREALASQQERTVTIHKYQRMAMPTAPAWDPPRSPVFVIVKGYALIHVEPCKSNVSRVDLSSCDHSTG